MDGGGLRVENSRNRSRSAKKRSRGKDGSIIEVEDNQKLLQPRSKKFLVGTSNAQSGRKMRSPPADKFVYGVHPATTMSDIVQDLAGSQMK